MRKTFSIAIIFLFIIQSQLLADKFHKKIKKKVNKDFAHFVLKAQSDNKMGFPIRNIKYREGLFKFFDKFEDHMGVAEKGIVFNIKYSDKGHKNDWSRWGNPGHAQRFQIEEPFKNTSKKGEIKWYRIGYFIPKELKTEKHNISLFDFKMIYGKPEKAVGPSFNFNNNNFNWIFNSSNYKKDKNEVGVQYYYDTYTVDLDTKFSPLKGKWVNLLINVNWAKDGFLHLWIDGKLRSSYFGDMMGEATRARFKFGPYRNHMDQATDSGIKIQDAVIRYANVGKADNCDELWSDCSELTNKLSNSSQVYGAIAVVLCKSAPNQKSRCENLGYPKNARPF